MAITTGKNQNVPMSVRMQRVLNAVKRMPPADRFQLLVKAGLMTETEAQQAINRLNRVKKVRRKSMPRPTTSAKKTAKHSTP